MSFSNDPTLTKFTGKGMIFPIVLNDTGGITLSTGKELLRSAIRICLFWPAGTKFFNRRFGSLLDRLLEDPNDDISMDLATDYILETLDTYEKRIKVIAVDINRDDLGKLNIHINYIVKNSNLEDSFLIPYYKNYHL